MSQDHGQLLAHMRGMLARTAPADWVKTDTIAAGTAVDHALRCVLEVLRKGDPDHEVSRSWAGWVRALEPLIDDYNDRSYLVRMRAEDYDDD